MAQTRKNLIKNADTIFSLYVRNRGSAYGYNHCYTCGAYLPIESLQAGHFISRRYHNVRWHPVNVWPQCNHCNVDLGGNLNIYERKLANMFGEIIIDALWDLANTNDGLTEDEIKEIVKKYKNY